MFCTLNFPPFQIYLVKDYIPIRKKCQEKIKIFSKMVFYGINYILILFRFFNLRREK